MIISEKMYIIWYSSNDFFLPRFGIVYVDYKDLKRYPKMSALWFKQLLKRDQK